MAANAATLSPYFKLGAPRAPQAEQALLGALLLGAEGFSKIEGTVTDHDFYEEVHRRIFRVMVKLYGDGRNIDAVTLHEALKADTLYQDSGGGNYLTSLMERVGSQAHIEDYARIVKEKGVLRDLITAATEIYEDCYKEESSSDPLKPSDSIRDLLDRSENRIFKLAQARSTSGFLCVRDMVNPLMETLETARQKKVMTTGLPTGFKKLDELTSGLHNNELILIAARPGQGKTAFALNIASHVALEAKKAVAIFSLEMDGQQLLMRMVCAEAQADSQKLRKGYLERKHYENITHAASRFFDADIFIDDSRNLTPLEVRSRARRLHSQLRANSKELGLV
ncbi:MAG: DnaB-like helicase C-terminal domain-containing protein, partial [Elusimicrobiota bacterium]